MIASKKIRLDILNYLKEVYEENPSKIVKGKEIMDIFSIDEASLSGTLKLLEDSGLLKLMSDKHDSSAIVRITEKGLCEIENISK